MAEYGKFTYLTDEESISEISSIFPGLPSSGVKAIFYYYPMPGSSTSSYFNTLFYVTATGLYEIFYYSTTPSSSYYSTSTLWTVGSGSVISSTISEVISLSVLQFNHSSYGSIIHLCYTLSSSTSPKIYQHLIGWMDNGRYGFSYTTFTTGGTDGGLVENSTYACPLYNYGGSAYYNGSLEFLFITGTNTVRVQNLSISRDSTTGTFSFTWGLFNDITLDQDIKSIFYVGLALNEDQTDYSQPSQPMVFARMGDDSIRQLSVIEFSTLATSILIGSVSYGTYTSTSRGMLYYNNQVTNANEFFVYDDTGEYPIFKGIRGNDYSVDLDVGGLVGSFNVVYNNQLVSVGNGSTATQPYVATLGEDTITITYLDADGNVFEIKEITRGTAPGNATSTPTKSGYTFKEWTPSTSTYYFVDTTFTPVFDIETFSVYFYAKNDSGNVIFTTQTIDYGSTATDPGEPSEHPTHYHFSEWDFDFTTPITSDTVIFALYEEDPKYTINFYNSYQSPSLLESQTLYGDEEIIYGGSDPIRIGHTWTGWDPELTSGTYPTQDQDYYATFTINYYTVTWIAKDVDGNEYVFATESVAYQGIPTLPGTPSVPKNYRFVKWNFPDTPSGQMITGDTTFYAIYEEDVYTITFLDSDGVTILEQKEMLVGERITYTGETPYKEGYTFIGWGTQLGYVSSDATFTAQYVAGGRIHLYVSTAENNRLDKTDYLTLVGEIDGVLRKETSVMNPVITIQRESIDFNYVEIALFNRYYFVNEVVSVATNLWELHLTCDVLMTYRTYILELDAFISRNENEFDYSITDEKLPFQYMYVVETTSVEYYTKGTDNDIYWCNFFYDNTQHTGTVCLYSISDQFIYEATDTSAQPVLSWGTQTYELFNSNVPAVQSGSSSFSIMQLLDEDQYDNELSDIAKGLYDREDLASYVLGIVAYPFGEKVFSYRTSGGSWSYSSTVPLIGDSPASYFGNYYYKVSLRNTIRPFLVYFFHVDKLFSEIDFLNYEPYSQYEIYLPFVGWVSLNAVDILDQWISVYYSVDSGSTNCTVYVQAQPSSESSEGIRLIGIYNGTIGVQISISSTDAYQVSIKEQLYNLKAVTSGLGIVGGIAGLASGNILGGVSALSAGASGLVGTIIQSASNVSHASTGSTASGSNNCYTPGDLVFKITHVNVPKDFDYARFRSLVGAPLQQTKKIQQMIGFTQVAVSHIGDLGLATDDEKNAVERLLKEGIIL